MPLPDIPGLVVGRSARKGNTGMINIVVVDDEALIRRAYTDIFEDMGYSVTAFENGMALLEAFPRLSPDLIILDVQMPGLDGISVCREIRKTPGGMKTPIIIISGSCGRSEPDLIYSGANRFINKPVDTDDLIDAVTRTLQEVS